MPLTQGQTINNRYRIVKLIGQGGFGAVYRAWDMNVNRACALKENLDISTEAQRQFEREAILLGNLIHPHLPRVTDHVIVPHQGQYLVMDFVEGQSLDEILSRRGRPLSEAEVLPWIEQVCQALAYLHTRTQPIIHRDIKPQNIIITPENQAMLVDFGIAKVYDPHQKTTVGARAVTPGFSPIEQYGQGRTDARTDIYSLGATLYTLLTNQPPPESVERLSSGVELVPPRRINPQISRAVEQVIMQALALPPDHRFQNIPALLNALRGQGEASHASQKYVQPPTPAPMGGEKSKLLWIVGGSLIAIFLLAGAGFTLGRTFSATPVAATIPATTSSLRPNNQNVTVESAKVDVNAGGHNQPEPIITWTPTPTPKSPATWTSTPTPKPAATWTPTRTPRPATATPTNTLQPTPTPLPHYERPPAKFGNIWDKLGGVSGPLGVPGEIFWDRNYARQHFENGFMFWWDNPAGSDYIWAVSGNSDRWQRYTDTWQPGEGPYPPGCEAHDPNGPKNGFGKVWCNQSGVKGLLGNALQPEFGSGDVSERSILQFFSGGVMFYVPADGAIWALMDNNGWQRFNN